jgi:hypothetical protein
MADQMAYVLFLAYLVPILTSFTTSIEILRSETLSLKVETLHPGMTINFRERDATTSRTCTVLSIHHAPTLGRIFMVSFNPAEAPVPLLEDNMKELIARKI